MRKHVLFCLAVFVMVNFCANVTGQEKKTEFSIGLVVNPELLSIDHAGRTSVSNWSDYFSGRDQLLTFSGVEAFWRFGKGNFPLIVGHSAGISPVGLMSLAFVGTEYDFIDTPSARLGVRGLVHGGVDYLFGLSPDFGLRTELLWKIKLNPKYAIDLAAGLQVRTDSTPLNVLVPLTVAFSFM